MVLGYSPESKIDQDILLAGFLSNNLVYEKDEKNKEQGRGSRLLDII